MSNYLLVRSHLWKANTSIQWTSDRTRLVLTLKSKLESCGDDW
ncbi:hypothetical protein [Nostoc sp. DSM 114159]